MKVGSFAGRITGQVSGQIVPQVPARPESRLELEQRKSAMNYGIQLQISQMNADAFRDAFVCADLRHLRFTHLQAGETEKALWEIWKKIEV